MKKIKKIFASLLALAMAVTMVPMTAFADGTVGSSGMVTDKTAVLEDDGTYTINLSAYATGETTTTTVTTEEGVPLDIVLVIDQSGSMAYNDAGNETNTAANRRITKLKTAVNAFAASIAQNAEAKDVNHRIAMVGFAQGNSGNPAEPPGSGYNGNNKYWLNTGLYINGTFKNYGSNSYGSNKQLTATDYQAALTSANAGNGAVASGISSSINNLKVKGATNTYYGLEMANDIFKNNSNVVTGEDKTHKRIVVLFTDGETDSTKNNVLAQANTLKSTYNATVYTIAFGSGYDNDFLSHISSNYGSDTGYSYRKYSGTHIIDKYAHSATNSDALKGIFETISKDATETESSSTVTLDAQSYLKDVMANGLVMTDASEITVKTYAATTTDGKTISKGNATSNSVAIMKANRKTLTVGGFDYSKKYIAPSHPGEIIEVKITGVIPTDESVKNEIMDTNDQAFTGIFDKDGKIAAVFPQPKTILKDKAYVVDYAKPFNMSTADISMTSGSVYGGFNKVPATATYGNISGMTYTPNTMNWDGYDKFYVFGKTTDATIKSASANANGNVWGRMTVVPANNVYYDDDFVTSETTGTTGIEYTGEWTVNGTTVSSSEIPEGETDGAQGWIDALKGSATDSNGSSHSIDAASNFNSSKATFTFSGTGFDIYGRTSKATGTVMVNVKGNGISQTKIIDTISESSGDGAYYQIPTCSFSGLERGTYDVTVYVTAAAKDRLTFYMDGIRIYNPVAADDTVKNAYGEDESDAVFTQVREALQLNGTVFIDKDESGNPKQGEYEATEYGTYGPKNEVYLAAGQAVSFKVTDGGAYYVGMKSPNGAAMAQVTNGENTSSINVASTSDLYYKITPTDKGMITIKNNSLSGILSLTKIKAAGVDAQLLELMDAEPYLAYAAAFDSLEVVPYENEVVEAPVEDTTEVTAPDENVDNVVIENAAEEAAPEVTVPTVEKKWIAKLLSKFAKFFK